MIGANGSVRGKKEFEPSDTGHKALMPGVTITFQSYYRWCTVVAAKYKS